MKENPASGTAFFVGHRTLLTAGHTAKEVGAEVVAQIPGTREAELFVEDLLELRDDVKTFRCVCTATLLPFADISILDCSGTAYRAQTYIKPENVALKVDERVDVVGYPGLYSERYVREKHQYKKINSTAVKEINEILPKCQLTVTHGPVVSTGNVPAYRVSTMGGMSGAPVIMNSVCVGNVNVPSELIVKAFISEAVKD
jgi:hypothetical protein